MAGPTGSGSIVQTPQRCKPTCIGPGCLGVLGFAASAACAFRGSGAGRWAGCECGWACGCACGCGLWGLGFGGLCVVVWLWPAQVLTFRRCADVCCLGRLRGCAVPLVVARGATCLACFVLVTQRPGLLQLTTPGLYKAHAFRLSRDPLSPCVTRMSAARRAPRKNQTGVAWATCSYCCKRPCLLRVSMASTAALW